MSRIYGRSLLPALLCAAGFMFAGCGKESPPAPEPAPEPAQEMQEETPVPPSETTPTMHQPSTYHDALPPS